MVPTHHPVVNPQLRSILGLIFVVPHWPSGGRIGLFTCSRNDRAAHDPGYSRHPAAQAHFQGQGLASYGADPLLVHAGVPQLLRRPLPVHVYICKSPSGAGRQLKVTSGLRIVTCLLHLNCFITGITVLNLWPKIYSPDSSQELLHLGCCFLHWGLFMSGVTLV